MRRLLVLGFFPVALTMAACSSDDAGGGDDASTDGVADAQRDAAHVDAAPDVMDASTEDGDATIDASDALVADTNVPDTNDADTIADAADAAPVEAGPPTLALPASGVCTRTHWCWQWPKPFFTSLSGIWGASDSDVWVVGSSNASHYWQTTLAHWDGAAWRGLLVPASEGASLSTLNGTASNDIWGLTTTGGLFHYDGASWTSVPTGTGFALKAIWAVSSSEAYAAGASGTLRVWDGSAWNAMASGTTDTLTGLWASSPNDVWTLSASGVRHWDGATWTTMTTIVNPAAIWGAGPGEVYVLTGSSASVLFRWNGAAWSNLGQAGAFTTGPVFRLSGSASNSVFAVSDAYTAIYDGTYRASGVILKPLPLQIWGAGVTDVFSVGTATQSVAPLAHWNGTAWASAMSDTSAHVAVDAAYLGASDIWLAEGALSHFDGTKYTQVTPGTSQAMHVIEAVSPTDIWVGGTGGVVSHLAGTTWNAEATAGPQEIAGLRVFSATDVWAVGKTGAVYHRDASGWSDRTPGGETVRLAIGGISSSDLWVVGSSAHHWTGSAWSQSTLPQGFGPGVAVHAFGHTDVYALDGSGALARFDGASWTKVPTGLTFGSFAPRVVWTSPTDIWAASPGPYGDDIVHFDGTKWTRLTSGFEVDTVLGVFGSSGDLWTIGSGGSQARYQP